MARNLGKWIYPLILTIAITASGPCKANAQEEPLSPTGRYVKELMEAKGCIDVDWLPKKPGLRYIIHGERVGKPEDSFDLNIEAEEVGTPEAKVCGLKKDAPYQIIVREFKDWELKTLPGYAVRTAK